MPEAADAAVGGAGSMTGIEPAETVQVRPAGLADAEAVAEVLAAAYRRLLGIAPEDLSGPEAPAGAGAPQWIAPEILASGRYFVAELGDRLIAGGGWSTTVPGGGSGDAAAPAPGIGHVRDFATHPDCLRRGAARAILARTLDSARAAGMVELVCVSTTVAAPFYAAHGFVEEARSLIRMPGGAPMMVVRMARPLECDAIQLDR